MADQVPASVVSERYLRLTDLLDEISLVESAKLVGSTVELLVLQGQGRKNAATLRMSGRAADNRLVHFAAVDGLRPCDMVTCEVTYAAPHHMVADTVRSTRRTRAGDAWEARTAAPVQARGVSLGLPTVGVPVPLPTAPACG